MADSSPDYTPLIRQSQYLPGLLGQVGMTTRGVMDTITVFAGVALCIVGLIMIVSGTKSFKTATGMAVKTVKKGAEVAAIA